VLLPLYFSQIEVHGIEHLPRSGAVILAPTHRSRWDGFVVSYAAGRRSMTGRYLHFMITANEMRGSQGWILRRLGGFAIDPQRPGVSSLRYGIELLQQGSPLVIFPEGGNLPKNRQFSLNRLHPGLARLAIQATLSQSEPSVLVVPIAIDYNHPQMAWRCQVQVRIGAPLSVSQYLTSNPKHSAHSLTVALATALQGLTHYQGPSQGPSQGNTAIPWET
jgi:1-acyl-sn-glycerol-3-phosphate acyltransferase